MASLFIKNGNAVRSISPDLYEKILAVCAAALLLIVAVALGKGLPHWALVPAIVWVHLATILIALSLTPYMLLRPRGTATHRLLGKIWVAAMTATAAITFFITHSATSRFSVIHLLSVVVILLAPRVWLTAKRHQLAAHRASVRGLVTGALIIAGYFTLLETRLLGHWLFG